MTAGEVRAAIDQFAALYVRDWQRWLATPADHRVDALGVTLRRWQATRPLPMRRPRHEATHPAPYLEDLVENSRAPLRAIGELSLRTIKERTVAQGRALEELWTMFSALTTRGSASCVGISKAVLLLTDGRIGPALDSQVRLRTGLGAPTTGREWLWALDEISDDLGAFEAMNSPLAAIVSTRFKHLEVGRLYDMALGPR